MIESSIRMKNKLLLFSTLVLLLASLSSLLPREVSAQECGGPVPTAPAKFWGKSGPMAGQVTLYWDAAPYANRYAIAYGEKSNTYIYGSNNIGGENTRAYTVNYLKPGVKYYFKVAAARDCSSSPLSKEVAVYALGGEAVQPAIAPKVVQKTPVVKEMMVQKQSAVSNKYGLWTKSGPKTGEVTLYWKHAENADNYHLVYGTSQAKFEYGVLNIGKVTKFTVGKLAPGKTYYFALVPVMNNMAMYTTDSVRGVAWMNTQVVETTKEALVMPKPVVKKDTKVSTGSPTIAPTTTQEEIPAGQ